MPNFKKVVGLALAASVTLASVRPSHAEETAEAMTLRAAAARAAAQIVDKRAPLTRAERTDLVVRAGTLGADPVAGQAMGGGGMGKMLIFTLLSTAIGVGAYYYVTKKNRDQTKTSSVN